jgi:hypothetical protein
MRKGIHVGPRVLRPMIALLGVAVLAAMAVRTPAMRRRREPGPR